MPTTSKPKTIKHDFTYGTCCLLKAFLPQRQWYKDISPDVVLAGIGLAENLSEFKEPTQKEGETAAAFEDRAKDILDVPSPQELSIKEREAAAACAKFYLKNAAWVLDKHVANAIKELEITKW
jgi:hypothetical protein